MNDEYNAALAKWRSGDDPRPHKRPDGIPTRIDLGWRTPAESAIDAAIEAVEAAGASTALTDAVTILSRARNRVADHVEGSGDAPAAQKAEEFPAMTTDPTPAQISVGDWRARNGEKMHVAAGGRPGEYSFVGWEKDGHLQTWTDNGRIYSGDHPHPCDLIAPWVDAPEEFVVMSGVGSIISARVHKNVADEYAAGANSAAVTLREGAMTAPTDAEVERLARDLMIADVCGPEADSPEQVAYRIRLYEESHPCFPDASFDAEVEEAGGTHRVRGKSHWRMIARIALAAMPDRYAEGFEGALDLAARTARSIGVTRWHGTKLEDACDEVAAAIAALKPEDCA